MASILASQPPAGTFDASAWLTAWADHGGIVLLTPDRLYLRRSPFLDRAATVQLDRLRDAMLRAGGGPEIAATLARTRDGDVA
jgi:hypothetical protein